MKKKICLIIPDSIFLLDSRVFPFLGILKVAAAWEQLGEKIDVLDLSAIENPFDVLNEYFSSNKDIEFAGLTATTPQIANTYDLATFIKQNWNHKLVLGGAHVTLMHTAAKREISKGRPDRAVKDIERLKETFDVLVCGDGELTLELIKQMDKGIIDGDDRYSPLFLSNDKFTDLPNPARHLIDLDSYNYFIDQERATSLISQLGCSFKCTFCFVSGTSITKLDGTTDKIENIKLGDDLLGYDFENREVAPTKVKSVIKSRVNELIYIHTSDGKVVKTTPEHPFLQMIPDFGQMWVEARDLTLDCKLVTPEKNKVNIIKLEKVFLEKEVEVYNFSCAPHETYVAENFIVHNCSGRNSPSLRKVRNRTVESILAELESIYKTYGYKAAMFYDDELNLTKQIHELMNGISNLSNKLGIDFKLRGFTKSELFNSQQAQDMYRAGFRWLLTGFESGDARILTNIQKNATRDDNTKCVETAHKHGLKVKALMSCGHAGESYETIENTQKWLLEAQPAAFDYTVISTFPGSPYFDDAIYDEDKKVYVYTSPKTGDKLYQKVVDYTKDAQFYKGIPGEYTSYVYTDYLSAEELVKLRDEVESTVRAKLDIPYDASNPARKYEHSMGSSKNMPDWVLRSTETHKPELDIPKKDPKILKVIQ